MKRVFVVIISLIQSIALLGQVRFIRFIDNNKDIECSFAGSAGNTDIPGAIGTALFNYRVDYGHYPNSKDAFLDYYINAPEFDSGDSLTNSLMRKRDSLLVKEVTNSGCTLVVSNDTCSVLFRDINFAVQCIGGLNELQFTNYYFFMLNAYPRAYNKQGERLWSYSLDSIQLPGILRKRFHFVVTFCPEEKGPMINNEEMRRVYIPITVFKSGNVSYNLSSVKRLNTYYQEWGLMDRKDILGLAPIERVIDSDYIEEIKNTVCDFMKEQPEVEIIRLWAPVLFKDEPTAQAT